MSGEGKVSGILTGENNSFTLKVVKYKLSKVNLIKEEQYWRCGSWNDQ